MIEGLLDRGVCALCGLSFPITSLHYVDVFEDANSDGDGGVEHNKTEPHCFVCDPIVLTDEVEEYGGGDN